MSRRGLRLRLHLTAPLAFALATVASAAEPTAELPAGGLVFLSQNRVALEREHLTISLDEIRIDYTLRNLEPTARALVMAFPAPTVDMAALGGADVSLPAFDPANPTNFVGFWTLVDDAPVAPEVEIEAHTLGHVSATRRLEAHGLPLFPLSPDLETKIAALSPAVRRELADDGLLDGTGEDAKPLWGLRTVFHWRVPLADRTPTVVRHAYRPVVGSGSWSADIAERARTKFCMSDTDAAELDRRAATGTAPPVYWVHYQPPSNAWLKGAADRFTLTIEKPRAAAIVATCYKSSSMRASTDTALEWTATERIDEDDIEVMIIE